MRGVVFLHAFPYSPRMWEGEVALLKTRLPVLAPTTWAFPWGRPPRRC